MEAGANIDLQDIYGSTVLDYSYREGKLDIVNYIVNYILEHQPDKAASIYPYANKEQIMEYPWLFAANDHGLLGLKHNT